jgi:cobalt-zinc-cadmium efflux system membrane fusion protein
MKGIAIAVLLVLAGGCKRDKAPSAEPRTESAVPSASAPDHEPHEELPRRIELSKKVMTDAKLQFAAVRREPLSETLSLPGEIAANPDQLARISSPAAGRIEAVRFKEGIDVKKGDVLVVLRVPEIGKVRSTFAATDAKARAARANAGRLRGLVDKRLASEQEALDAEAEAQSLEVEARSLNEQLGALGAAASGAFAITLKAPLSGRVIGRDAVVGQPVSSEQTLGTIAALDEVWFLGRVFEKDLGRVQVGANVEVALNAYPDQRFEGAVEYIGDQVDPSARTVTARVRLRNRQGMLKVGLFGTAQVELASGSAAPARLVVPRSAVTEVADKTVVFVKEGDAAFAMHDVTLGRAAPGRVEVLEGLHDGEVVVSEGAFTLKSITLKGSFAEEEE